MKFALISETATLHLNLAGEMDSTAMKGRKGANPAVSLNTASADHLHSFRTRQRGVITQGSAGRTQIPNHAVITVVSFCLGTT